MAFEELLVKLVSRLDDAGFKQLDKMETRAARQTQILSNGLRNMFVAVVGTVGAREILDASVKMDSLKTSFAALSGSGDAGAEQLNYVRKEADRLGQSFYSTAEAYKNLFSAGMGANMDVEEIQNIFSSVLEAGTVLGSSKEQMSRALLALEQMISKGKVSMEELRQQLGEAVPGAMQIAAKAMGVTTTELQEMLEAGLDSKMFVKAFADQLHRDFGGKAAAAAHTLRAELARLETAFFMMKTAILDGDAGKELGTMIGQLAKIVESPALLKSLSAIGKVIVLLLKNIRLIAAVAIVLGVRRLIATIALLRLELLTTTFAAGSLGAAMQLFVGGSIVAGLRAITVALWATLKPLALWIAALLLIVELIDTIRGKRTVFREIAEATPTLKQAVNSEKFQRQRIEAEKTLGFRKDAPLLQDSGLYNKDGSLKRPAQQNNNNVTINISTNSDNPQAVGEATKLAMLDVFETVRTRGGYPQATVV